MNAPPPDPHHAGYYAGRGFLYVGLIGGGVSHVVVSVAQACLDKRHPLNTEYQEAYGWVPGLFLASGPLLGCGWYLVKRFLFPRKPPHDTATGPSR